MSTATGSRHPIDDAQAAEDARFYRQILHDVIEMGAEIARAIHGQAVSEPTPELTTAFDRIARTIRRTVALARKVAEPPREPNRTETRSAARREIIRSVEDRIQRRAEGPEAEALRSEFAERLDAPDMEDDISQRPVPDIIEEICRDLGLETWPGSHAYTRRTPPAVAALIARAASPPRVASFRHGPCGPETPMGQVLEPRDQPVSTA